MLQFHTPSQRHHKKQVQYMKQYNLLGWTRTISTLLTFFSSACRFFHSLFAMSSIIVSQSNIILHNSSRKIFAVKANEDTNPNESNIEATIFNIALFVNSSLSNVKYETVFDYVPFYTKYPFFDLTIKACTY